MDSLREGGREGGREGTKEEAGVHRYNLVCHV
jgi:hypothetical protein